MQRSALVLTAVAVLAGSRLAAQSVVDRTPLLAGPWLAPAGVLQFDFVHRFQESGAPEHRISNSPTFTFTTGLARLPVMAGVAYATNSDVVSRMPNEWEFFLRAAPLPVGNRVADLWMQLGYNQAARSLDGELGASRELGPLRLLASGRVFSNAFDAGDWRFAAAGGAVLRLLPFLALAGDVAALNERLPDENVVWSAGVQLGIPGTPHSLSIQATNAETSTLEGSSRAASRVRYGFEYTVPIPFLRHGGKPKPAAASARSTGATASGVVTARIRDFSFAPARIEIPAGTTVVWINEGAEMHTVEGDDGAGFDSGSLVGGSGTWSFRFTRPGTYRYHCGPHPYMRGVVVVR